MTIGLSFPTIRERRVTSVLACLALGVLSACGGADDEVVSPVETEVASLEPETIADEGLPEDEEEALPAQVARPVALPPASVAAPGEIDTSNWVVAPPFYAAGDEPYWRLDIQDGWFIFRRAGLPAIEAPMVPPIKDGRVDIFEAPPLSIQVSRSACTTADGESSAVKAAVWFDDVPFEGCVFEGQSAGASAGATAVQDSIVAVDSCLTRLGDTAVVTGIYERGGGQTALGLRTKDGRLFECVTQAGGDVVAFLDPVEPGAAGPWMLSGMRFLRAGQGADACSGDEEITAAGQVLGHMLAAACRF